MSIGLSKSEITRILNRELSDVSIQSNDLDKVVKAITVAIDKNNYELERELRNIRNLIP